MTMKIYIIAVKNDYDPPWVATAWDEYTIDENPSGFAESLQNERKSHGVDSVAVGIIHVSNVFLDRLFLPRETMATKEETVSSPQSRESEDAT